MQKRIILCQQKLIKKNGDIFSTKDIHHLVGSHVNVGCSYGVSSGIHEFKIKIISRQ